MTDFVRNTIGRIVPYVALLFGVFLSCVILANYINFWKFSNDFSVYWRTANGPVEMAYLWTGRFPFPYAPTMLLWIQPLTFIPKWPAYFLFIGVSMAAFVLACRPYLSKAAIGLAVISPSFTRGIFTGQVCAILSALMLWAFGTANRLGAGIALGVIASIKPQLVVMAPLILVLNRDWRAFNGAWASFLSIVVLSLAFFGTARWPEWLASMDHFHRMVADTSVIEIAITPAAIAERLGYPPLPFMLLGAGSGAALVFLCRNSEPVEKTAAVATGSLLSAPYALGYDLAPVLPFLALMVMRGRLLAAFAIAPITYTIPLLISTYELLRRTPLPMRKAMI